MKKTLLTTLILTIIILSGCSCNQQTDTIIIKKQVIPPDEVYGELWFHDDDTPLLVPIPTYNTYYNVTGLNTGSTSNTILTNSTIQVNKNGTYQITFLSSFNGGANTEYKFELKINNEEKEKCEFHRKIGTGNDVGSGGFTCIQEITTNDIISIAADCETNPPADLSITSLNINIHKIGE